MTVLDLIIADDHDTRRSMAEYSVSLRGNSTKDMIFDFK